LAQLKVGLRKVGFSRRMAQAQDGMIQRAIKQRQRLTWQSKGKLQ